MGTLDPNVQIFVHGAHCPRPLSGKCLDFSTDGTRVGAEIAHTMGQDDEEKIIEDNLRRHRQKVLDDLDGMDAEQADWEEGLDDDDDD